MHTTSGRRFVPGTEFAPTIPDIAEGLAGIPRWAGATIMGYSVLQHALAGEEVARVRGLSPYVRFVVLNHDDEEMATGDIPTPFKTDSQKKLAADVRDWIFEASFGVAFPEEGSPDHDALKVIDQELMLSELLTLCHPRAWLDPAFGDVVQDAMAYHMARDPEGPGLEVMDAVWSATKMPRHVAVEAFVQRNTELLAAVSEADRVAAAELEETAARIRGLI